MVVAAKGAKRPYSQLRPVLLPFQRLNVQFGKAPADEAGRGAHLRSAEWAGGVPMPVARRCSPASTERAAAQGCWRARMPHPELFDMYADTLQAMAQADEAGTQAALRAFELLLLRETGRAA
jgi:DNA repair protein RecO (recombination protein O)